MRLKKRSLGHASRPMSSAWSKVASQSITIKQNNQTNQNLSSKSQYYNPNPIAIINLIIVIIISIAGMCELSLAHTSGAPSRAARGEQSGQLLARANLLASSSSSSPVGRKEQSDGLEVTTRASGRLDREQDEPRTGRRKHLHVNGHLMSALISAPQATGQAAIKSQQEAKSRPSHNSSGPSNLDLPAPEVGQERASLLGRPGSNSESTRSDDKFAMGRLANQDAQSIKSDELVTHQNQGEPVGVDEAEVEQEQVEEEREDESLVALRNQYFDESGNSNRVQVHVGESAYLSCRLRANEQRDSLIVSWIRREHEILTSGEFRQTSDERFRSNHQAGSADWTLEIQNAQEHDAGFYECQVNSEPSAARRRVHLEILRARLDIREDTAAIRPPGSSLDFSVGEQLQLSCRLEFHPTSSGTKSWRHSNPSHSRASKQTTGSAQTRSQRMMKIINRPEEAGQESSSNNTTTTTSSDNNGKQYYIYWYRDETSIQYQHRKGQSIRFERRAEWSSRTKLIESVLTIDSLIQQDSGLYSCRCLPELLGVGPAQTRVSVRSSSSQSLASGFLWSMGGSHTHSAASSLLHNDLLLLLLLLVSVSSLLSHAQLESALRRARTQIGSVMAPVAN